MKKHIPNLFTLLNLLCGSISVIFIVKGDIMLGAFFMFLGIFFDFFDGFFARKLNVSSELGLQLDSLADMITSGLVPGLVMFYLLGFVEDTVTTTTLNTLGSSPTELFSYQYSLLPFLGLLITLASGYRLAKFNISNDQSEGFIGLPTPANALLIMSLPLILEFQDNDLMNAMILNKWFLIGLTILSCYLLNSNIKMLKLKFDNFTFKDNAAKYMLIILSIVLLVIFQFAAIPLVILTYIIVSLLNR